MECYYEKNDEETRMVDDIAIVRASFPLAGAMYGRSYIGGFGRGYSVYGYIRNSEIERAVGGLSLLGIGRTEEEAWYSAARVVQIMMLQGLEK